MNRAARGAVQGSPFTVHRSPCISALVFRLLRFFEPIGEPSDLAMMLGERRTENGERRTDNGAVSDCAELPGDRSDRLDRAIEVLAGVGRADLAAEARMSLRHDGKAESRDVDAPLEELA